MQSERSPESTNLSRRNLLVGAGALATVAAAGSASAATGHEHAKHAPQRPALLEALEDCNATGLRCISHCLVAFGEGDTTLAACAGSVHEMMAVCSAMATLTASNSSHSAALAKVCAQICEACAAECRKHAEMHRECRDCMEACEAVLPQLEMAAA